ncbi:MAG: 16S rRNA (cytidine(1402)-2'-O)-methyltransferase [Brevinematales bacterium]|nr:16S rRNA (cytidine(1402)-2'-O)-methyltransferase [Brevinematales bacterium]
MPGKLYIVATPIGNLSDITLRALETLRNVDIIACENTSRHLKLLSHFDIKKRIIEYSPKNEEQSANGILKLILEDKNIALVSDAGTPLISDPGKKLLSVLKEKGISIVPIPGVSALTTIMSIANFPTKNLIFLGFLPKIEGKIKKELTKFIDIEATIVFFASSYQIKKILDIIKKIYGNVEIIIGREMTKENEEFIEGHLEEIIEKGFKEIGEFTVAFLNKTKD